MTAVPRLAEIVFDALDSWAFAHFLAEVLDGYRVGDWDAAEIARLAQAGLTPRTDPSVAVDGSAGLPTLFFQRASHPKSSRNRVHLDVVCPDRGVQVVRLVGLGAKVRDTHATFTVMQDPAGNEFCVRDEG